MSCAPVKGEYGMSPKLSPSTDARNIGCNFEPAEAEADMEEEKDTEEAGPAGTASRGFIAGESVIDGCVVVASSRLCCCCCCGITVDAESSVLVL